LDLFNQKTHPASSKLMIPIISNNITESNHDSTKIDSKIDSKANGVSKITDDNKNDENKRDYRDDSKADVSKTDK